MTYKRKRQARSRSHSGSLVKGRGTRPVLRRVGQSPCQARSDRTGRWTGAGDPSQAHPEWRGDASALCDQISLGRGSRLSES
jgi:hypothetical protein